MVSNIKKFLKNKNMKQILSLALALLPCLAWAQYPSNGNQKITLGEQTTADGLIWRGVAADTTLTAKSDTAAYFVLDTVNINLYTYKASASGRKWRQLGADTAAIAYVNTYGTQTVNGAKTFSSTVTGARFDPTSSSATGNGMYLSGTNTLGFSTNSINRLTINSSGNIGVGTTPLNIGGAAKWLTMEGTAYGGGLVSSVNGVAKAAYYYEGGFGYFQGFAGVGVQFLSSNTIAVTVDTMQRLGIGTTTPTEKLHVVGNARITGAYDVTTGSAANVFVTTTGVLQRSTSSIKYKMDVEDYNKGLNEVMKLRPVTYKSINTNNDKIYAGFIAEELADLKLTELYENNDNGEPDAISYAYMVTLLTKAIQQQQSQIDELKKRIINLENK